MGVAVRVRQQGSVTVVSLSGVGEPELLTELAPGILELVDASRPLVIDLTDTVLLSGSPLRSFLHAVLGHGGPSPAGDVRLVCGRLSGRKALRRCAPEVYALVFGSVEMAIGTESLPTSA